VWSDYLGDTIYGDFTVNPSTGDVTMARTYLSPWAHMEAGGFEPVYYHADHLGTTRLLSQQGQGGYNILSHVYTAFGEAETVPASPPADAATRYGYVGAHGYETGLLTFTGGQGSFPMTLQHVGERWYDPALGRFLQRDPIGIEGGLNVYAYARNVPTIRIDPSGVGPILWPPPPTGPENERMFDEYWTKVHWAYGWLSGCAGISLPSTVGMAVAWELSENVIFKDQCPSWGESIWNIFGDIIAAIMGWIDAQTTV
jgi:RHS repeat-associated protein